MPTLLDFVLVGILGGLVGTSELVARYRDAPNKALNTFPALLYIAINVSAALAALAIARAFGWTFGATTDATVRWTQILVAGFGAMALFRSSLFIVRAGNQDIGVGPSSLLQVALSAADREVDRLRATSRNLTVVEVMKGISFDKAKDPLPAYCIALLQGASADDQAELAKSVASLANSSADNDTKALILGLLLMNLVGEQVLTGAVDALRPRIGA